MNHETEKLIASLERRIGDFERNFQTALRNAISGFREAHSKVEDLKNSLAEARR